MSVPTNDDIAEQAAAWLTALQTSGPTGRRDFVTWLRQSPEHLQLFLEMTSTNDLLERVHRSGLIDVDALMRESQNNVVRFKDD